MKDIRLALLLCLVAVFTSCDKFLDIRPTGKVIAETGDEYRALLTSEYKNFPEDRGWQAFAATKSLLMPLPRAAKTTTRSLISGHGTINRPRPQLLRWAGDVIIMPFILPIPSLPIAIASPKYLQPTAISLWARLI